MHFKSLEGKPERESSKRIIFASGGLGLLHKVFFWSCFDGDIWYILDAGKGFVLSFAININFDYIRSYILQLWLNEN